MFQCYVLQLLIIFHSLGPAKVICRWWEVLTRGITSNFPFSDEDERTYVANSEHMGHQTMR